jgi:hypothetical protein
VTFLSAAAQNARDSAESVAVFTRSGGKSVTRPQSRHSQNFGCKPFSPPGGGFGAGISLAISRIGRAWFHY